MTPPRRRLIPASCIALALLALAAAGAHAGDAKAGRARAMLCQGCHGMDGLSKVPDAPNIAGQVEPYLVAQLKAFRSGARKSEQMTLVSASLSDKDIEDLAAYYAAIEVKLGRIPGG